MHLWAAFVFNDNKRVVEHHSHQPSLYLTFEFRSNGGVLRTDEWFDAGDLDERDAKGGTVDRLRFEEEKLRSDREEPHPFDSSMFVRLVLELHLTPYSLVYAEEGRDIDRLLKAR